MMPLTYQEYMGRFRRIISTIMPGTNLDHDRDVLTVMNRLRRLNAVASDTVAVSLPEEFDQWLAGDMPDPDDTFDQPPAPIIPEEFESETNFLLPGTEKYVVGSDDEDEDEDEDEALLARPGAKRSRLDHNVAAGIIAQNAAAAAAATTTAVGSRSGAATVAVQTANPPQEKKKKGPGGLTPPLQKPNESDAAYQQRRAAWDVQARARLDKFEEKKEKKRERNRESQKRKRQEPKSGNHA